LKIHIREGVLRKEFEGETILLNLQTGDYYALNATGTRMCGLLVQGLTTEETAARTAAEFQVPVASVSADLEALLRDLVKEGLVAVQ
jgi:Coenzyme PQQ synthesis protein D (PqqD)